jgi:hypothetical protein
MLKQSRNHFNPSEVAVDAAGTRAFQRFVGPRFDSLNLIGGEWLGAFFEDLVELHEELIA